MIHMTPDERAAKKKRDKQRQKANKNKATTIRPGSSVGSPISGSGSAKVKAHKDVLPGMIRVDRTTANLPGFDAPMPWDAPRVIEFNEGMDNKPKKWFWFEPK